MKWREDVLLLLFHLLLFLLFSSEEEEDHESNAEFPCQERVAEKGEEEDRQRSIFSMEVL